MITPSRVTDRHLLAGAVAGQQVERQAAVVAPERVDGQTDVVELVDQAAQRRLPSAPASPARWCRTRRVRGGSASRPGTGPARRATAPRAASQLQPNVSLCVQRTQRCPSICGHTVGDRQHRLRRRVKAECGVAVRAPVRLERGEVVAHRTGECAHGQYGVTVQLLLVRHALPLRSEPGQGSDPDLSEEGIEQAKRLPDALARFPHHSAGQQPAAALACRPRSRLPMPWG